MKLSRIAIALTAVTLAAGAIAVAQAATDETIVTVVKVTGINWFNRMDDGVKEFAKSNPGVNAYQTGPGRADAAQQLKIIEDLIAKKVTAIAVVPYDPPTLEPALKKAMDRGIKGALLAPSAYLMKSPPEQWSDEVARTRLETFIGGAD